MSVNDAVERYSRHQGRGVRGGSGPDRSSDTYTGPGHTADRSGNGSKAAKRPSKPKCLFTGRVNCSGLCCSDMEEAA